MVTPINESDCFFAGHCYYIPYFSQIFYEMAGTKDF